MSDILQGGSLYWDQLTVFFLELHTMNKPWERQVTPQSKVIGEVYIDRRTYCPSFFRKYDKR